MAFPESDQRRWLSEVRDLEARLGAAWHLTTASPAMAEGELVTAAGLRRFRLAWPPAFPFRPPNIWELDSAGNAVDHRPSGHAFSDSSVCLFGHTPEFGWKPELTAANAIDRLREFLEATDRSAFPRVDVLPLEVPFVRFSIHPNLMAVLRANSSFGVMHGFHREDGRFALITGAQVTTAAGLASGLAGEDLPERWLKALGLVEPWHGFWCRVDASLGDDPPTRARFAAWLAERVASDEARGAMLQQPALLLIGEREARFVWLRPPDRIAKVAGERVLFVVPVEEEIPQKVFARADARLDNAAHLRGARVAIVGTGSLGGTAALALAKAGVGRFTLFDGEGLEPENVARHVGGLRDVGLPKVDAVARAIARVNPDADVVPVRAPLSLDPADWHFDAVQRLEEVLADPLGVVLCATASSEVEHVVNAISVASGVPAVYGAVLGDAEHARVFRVVPGQTPCYACVLLAQSREPKRFPKFDRADVGAPAYATGAFPGLGIDVDEIAMIAARLALQTLALRIPGGIGYPAAHGDHFIWSARGDWAVDGPLQVRVERMQRQADCPICGPRAASPLDPAERSELDALLARARPQAGLSEGGPT